MVQEYKNKKTVIDEDERVTIVENIKAVDEGIIVNSLDKEEVLKQVHFDVVFIGDDWKGSQRWNETEKALAKHIKSTL